MFLGWFSFKIVGRIWFHQKLWNGWSDFEIISQEIVLCLILFKIVCKILIRRKTWPPWGRVHCMDLEKFFKILLLWNGLSDFEIISQDCSLGDLFKIVFKILIRQKTWPPWGGGLFVLYGHEEILKKSSSLKTLVRFGNNFTGMFLGWPFSKSVCKILIGRKHGRRVGGDFCTK